MIVSREKVVLSNNAAVAAQLRRLIQKKDSLSRNQEHFWVISLNGRNAVKFIELIGLGTTTSCIVHPREVFRRALRKGAVAVIVGHWHPSGDVQPSEEDIALTRRLKECGELLGIKLLDHVIIGNGSFSFSEKGLI